jgi:hypothetical protein
MQHEAGKPFIGNHDVAAAAKDEHRNGPVSRPVMRSLHPFD